MYTRKKRLAIYFIIINIFMLTFPNVMPVATASPALTDLSPQDMVILPNRHLINFSASIVVSSTFQDHLNRTPPSNSPGVDIAVHYCYNNEQTDLKCHSEFDPLVYKAEIRSNASGTLVSVNHGEWGTIRIKDDNGFIHKYHHLHRSGWFLWDGYGIGDRIPIHHLMGFLGNTSPSDIWLSDHLHYCVYIPVDGNDLMAKEYYDPQELKYLQSSGAVYFEPETPVIQASQNLIFVP